MKITKRQLRRIIKEAIGAGDSDYDRGYQDGLAQYPEEEDATREYTTGYDDAMLDRSRSRKPDQPWR